MRAAAASVALAVSVSLVLLVGCGPEPTLTPVAEAPLHVAADTSAEVAADATEGPRSAEPTPAVAAPAPASEDVPAPTGEAAPSDPPVVPQPPPVADSGSDSDSEPVPEPIPEPAPPVDPLPVDPPPADPQPAHPPAPPPEPPREPAVTPTPPADPTFARPWDVWRDEFVGSHTCKKCHFKQHRAWKKAPMSQALATLAPTPQDQAELRARKAAVGLDPDRDYSADPACTPCHVTGYGAPGGYPPPGGAVPESGVDGVGCESCHGPGGRYALEKAAAIEADRNAKFDAAVLAGWGMVTPTTEVCERCHNPASPTYSLGDDPFGSAPDAGHPGKQKR